LHFFVSKHIVFLGFKTCNISLFQSVATIETTEDKQAIVCVCQNRR